MVSILPDFFSEREYTGNGHLEMPDAEGDSNDRYAEKKAEGQVKNSNLPPSKQNPNKVHEHRQASGLIGPVNQLVTKRPQRISAQFEELETKGNADERNTHHQAHYVIEQGDDNAAEEEPEYITDRVHVTKIIGMTRNGLYL